MQIHGPSYVTGASSIHHIQRSGAAEAADRLHGFHGADQVDISSEAEQISRAGLDGSVRADRIAQIRQEIAAGTYETHEKLDIAIGRLLDELSG
jgi:negative regulator of flagellin synthesis FlgM